MYRHISASGAPPTHHAYFHTSASLTPKSIPLLLRHINAACAPPTHAYFHTDPQIHTVTTKAYQRTSKLVPVQSTGYCKNVAFPPLLHFPSPCIRWQAQFPVPYPCSPHASGGRHMSMPPTLPFPMHQVAGTMPLLSPCIR